MRRRALHTAELKRVTHREYPLVPGEGLCHVDSRTVRNIDHFILERLIETFLEHEWNEIRSPIFLVAQQIQKAQKKLPIHYHIQLELTSLGSDAGQKLGGCLQGCRLHSFQFLCRIL